MEVLHSEARPGQPAEVVMVAVASNHVDDLLRIGHRCTNLPLLLSQELPELLSRHVACTAGGRRKDLPYLGWGLSLGCPELSSEAEAHLVATHCLNEIKDCLLWRRWRGRETAARTVFTFICEDIMYNIFL